MRVLIVGTNYAPEETGIGPYTTGIAEHFAGQGHAVTVLTAFPHYPQGRVRAGYGSSFWKRETLHGVDVRRRRNRVAASSASPARAMSEATRLLAGLSAVTLAAPDAVLGVVPGLSDGVLARLVAARFRAPYGLVFQDLVAPGVEQSEAGGRGRVSGLVRKLEGWAARGAAATGVIAEGFRPYVESLGVAPEGLLRVRNWARVSAAALDRAEARDRLAIPRDAILCLHAGNVGRKQGLENVIECARLAERADARLLFVLVGDGNRMRDIEAMAADYRLANPRVLPLLPSDLFSSALGAADILLLNQRASVVDMALPSKLTSYFAAGRPVVAAVNAESEAAREVRASGGGVVVPPDDPAALLYALSRLGDDPERAEALGAAGRAWSRSVLSRSAALAQYDELLRAVSLAAVPKKVEPRAPAKART